MGVMFFLLSDKNCLIILGLFFAFCVSPEIFGGEVDQFTPRVSYHLDRILISPADQKQEVNFYSLASDSAKNLNKLTEDVLRIAAQSSNNYSSRNSETMPSMGCDRMMLAGMLRKTFDTVMFTDFYKNTFNHPGIEVFYIHRRDSIYQTFDGSDGIYYSSKIDERIMSPLLRIGDHIVGTDKIDHFFEFGEYLYHIARENKDLAKPAVHKWEPIIMSKPTDIALLGAAISFTLLRWRNPGNLIDALEFSHSTELGSFGLHNNGIYSYADIMANYKGLLFYQQLFEGERPYFTCQGGEWVRTERNFDWREHVDGGWDESINCSRYASQATAEKVNIAIDRLGVRRCPVAAGECKELGSKYRSVQDYVLHPACRTDDQ